MKNELPEHLKQMIRESWKLEVNDTSLDDEIAKLSKTAQFDLILTWNGLINWGDTVREWVKDIYGIRLEG